MILRSASFEDNLYTAWPKMSVYENAFGYSHDFLVIFCQQHLRQVQVLLFNFG